MENKINSKTFSILALILSLVFITPLSISSIYAAEDEPAKVYKSKSQVKTNICGGGVSTKDSLVLSIVTLCLPGILEKTYEWKQIKCETIKCSYEAVKNDLDPSFCKKQEGYRTCKYVVGEMFALPPMSILEYWRNAIAQLMANPMGIAYAAGVAGARYYLFEHPHPYNALVDGAAATFLAVSDIMAIIQTLSDMFENGFFPPLEAENACDGIEDIQSELEEVVKYA
ncbi:MAG: hypothetical protein KC589_08310 [Nanoarchaeota archaeon]|nr:hypothetical protein [Nanoarchaeota archaeon]